MVSFINKSLIAIFVTLLANVAVAEKTVDVKYTSYKPSLRELISGDYKKQPVSLTAKLVLPDGDGPFPALVWVHGIGGQRVYEDWGWMDRLKQMSIDRGIALFVIDSYTERGLNPNDVVQGKVILNMAARLTDTFTATNALLKDKRIDSNKVYVIGHSFGGLVSIASASTLVQNGVKDLNVKFSGHIPIAPECLTRPADLNYDGTPILIIAGEKDEMTPARHCVDLVSSVKQNQNIDLKIVVGGTHGLMNTRGGSWDWSTYSYDGCGRWVFDDKGGYSLPDKGGVDNGPGVNEFNRTISSCAKNTSINESGSIKVRGEVESLIAQYLDKFVLSK